MAWEAAGATLAFLLVGFTLLALVDRLILIEDSTRQWSAVFIYLAAIAGAVWLVRRVLRPRSPETIALEIESRAPKEIQERISTTVELAARRDSGARLSAAMVQQVANEAAECIQALNIDRLVDRSGMRRALRAAAAVGAIVLTLCIPAGLRMRSAYARAFLPWVNMQRLGSTGIEVLTGSTRVVEGEALEVQVRTTGELVADAWLETRQPGGRWQPLRMSEDNAPGRYTLKLGPLHEKVEYRARAGDSRSAAYQIDVLPRPEIASLKFTIQYPAAFFHLSGAAGVRRFFRPGWRNRPPRSGTSASHCR